MRRLSSRPSWLASVSYFFFGPEAVKRILQDNNRNYVRPDARMDVLRMGLRGGDSVFTANGEDWLRQCIGMPFALTEAVLVLATVCQRYHLRLVDGHVVEPYPLFTVRTRNKLPMWVEARSR